MKWWREIVLIVLAAGVYANTANHDYALDDKAIIVHNKFTKKGFGGIAEHFTHSYWYGLNGKDAGNYRPISGVSFSIERGLFGDSPKAGHIFNILFYTIMCLVVFKWLLALNILPKNLLLMAMLLFAAHPIHTEVVANIKSRDEIYCLLFLALSAYQYWHWLKSKKAINLIASSLLYLLALLSKETAIALLPIFPLMAMKHDPTLINAVKRSIAPVSATAVYLTLYLSVTEILQNQEYHVFDNALFQSASASEILATKFWIIGEYARLLFIPYPLVYDYSFNTIALVGFGDIQVLLTLGGLALLLAWRIKQFIGRSETPNQNMALILALLILPLVPVSNLIFTIGSTMAERFLFIPSLGFCLLLVMGIDWLLQKLTLNKPAIIWGFVGLIALLYTSQSITRNKAWESDETLFANDIQHLPQNAKAHHNLADIFKEKAVNSSNESQRVTYYETAARLLEQALSIYEVQEFHRDLGQIYGELGKWDGVKKSLGKYVKLNPNDATAWMQLGLAHGISQNMDEAKLAFEKAYSLQPSSAEICLNLAKTYAILGEIEKAKTLITKCQSVAPNDENIQQLATELGQTL